LRLGKSSLIISMVQGIDGSLSVFFGLIIPKLLLHKLIELGFDLNHNVQLLLLEFKSGVEFLWVVWEAETVLEVNIVEPFLHIVLEETE
jgi:hypothetical protein